MTFNICPICGEPFTLDGEQLCDCDVRGFYCDICGIKLKSTELDYMRCKECQEELENF